MIPLILTLALILFMVCIILLFCLQVKRSEKRAHRLHTLFHANPKFLE